MRKERKLQLTWYIVDGSWNSFPVGFSRYVRPTPGRMRRFIINCRVLYLLSVLEFVFRFFLVSWLRYPAGTAVPVHRTGAKARSTRVAAMLGYWLASTAVQMAARRRNTLWHVWRIQVSSNSLTYWLQTWLNKHTKKPGNNSLNVKILYRGCPDPLYYAFIIKTVFKLLNFIHNFWK